MVIPIIVPMPMGDYGRGESYDHPNRGFFIASLIFLFLYLTLPLTARLLWVDFPGLFGAVLEAAAPAMGSLMLAIFFGVFSLAFSIFALIDLEPIGRWWLFPTLTAVLMGLWIPVLWWSLSELVAARCVELIATGALYLSGCS